MRLAFPLTIALALTGCTQEMTVTSPRLSEPMTAMAAPPSLDLAEALKRFTDQEGRKVTANHITPANGQGGATLTVPLSPKDRSLLVQLYRLNPVNADAAQFPAGVLNRAADQIAVLHHFELPKDVAVEAGAIKNLIRPRLYLDEYRKPLAYEAFVKADAYQLAGKYDLKGRLLQLDMNTWQ